MFQRGGHRRNDLLRNVHVVILRPFLPFVETTLHQQSYQGQVLIETCMPRCGPWAGTERRTARRDLGGQGSPAASAP